MPYTHLYSVHPYWWKRQVSQQTLPSGSRQARKSAGEIHSGFETHEEGHTKSKTGAISGSTKWALVQQIFFKKKEEEKETISLTIAPVEHRHKVISRHRLEKQSPQHSARGWIITRKQR